MSIAYAHGGGHASGVEAISLLGDWTFDPVFLFPLVLAWFYLRGFRRYRKLGGRRFPFWRVAMFFAGVAVLALALLSPVDALADVSFTFHMVQHQLIMMAGVPFILLGAPFVPVIRGLPRGFLKRVFIPLARLRAVRALVLLSTRPMVGFAAFQAMLVTWHMPGLYDAALNSPALHYLEHFTFAAAATMFWWNVVRPYPFPAKLGYLMRMLMLFGASIPNSFAGAMITFAEEPLYGYKALDGFWGLSALADQTLGGQLMGVMGGMMFLLAMTVVFIVYAQEEARKEPQFPLVPARR